MRAAHDDPISILLERSHATPGAPIVTWIEDDGSEGETLTAAALVADASAIAVGLRERAGLAPGEHVLLALAPSLDFVRAFTACMLARLVPVPAYPPNPFTLDADLRSMRRLALDAASRVAIADAPLVDLRVEAGRGAPPANAWPDARLWSAAALVVPALDVAWRPPAPSDVAFLQYTSGSTAEPRGVRITYANLAHQLAENRKELRLGPNARAVLWVPPYHDLGLISGLMSAIAGNGHLHQMSPLAFVRRPALWLEVASRVRATHTAAPNFAFGLVLRKTKPEERARLRLDALEVLMSAGEPIVPETVDAFLAAFSPAGLRREAFCAAYGLAEHTVGVSVWGARRLRLDPAALERGVARASDDERAKAVQGSGRPSEEVHVCVVDPATGAPLGEDRVGEIWVDSPSKADGYHGLPELSEHAFRARTTDPADARRYLRTGDLGFFHEGEIFVSGRLKDLMIFRGRNVLPADVEETAARAHGSVRPGCVTAFSVPGEDGVERLVVVADVKSARESAEAEQALQAISSAVQRAHGEPCHAIVLVAAGTVPKTTSGKLQRRACREAFLRGELTSGAACVASMSLAASRASSRVPGLASLDDSMRRLFARFVNVFSNQRHKGVEMPGVTARGTLVVLGAAGLPRHAFLAEGNCYPVLVRHTNTNREPDDTVLTGRAASIRVLDPTSPGDLQRSLLDLMLQTGRLGLVRDALAYVRWFVEDARGRAALAEEHPSIRRYFEDFWRDPPSFTEMHYHTQGTSHFIAADGGRYLARFRLAEAQHGRDLGHVSIDGTDFLAGHLPRRPDETRSPAHLREEFLARIQAGGVCYRLAVQVRPEPDDEAARDDALDPTIGWDLPFYDVAELRLDTPVATDAADPIGFNTAHAPPELGLVHARSARDPASVNHLRSLVYDLVWRLRRGEPLPSEYRALLFSKPAAETHGRSHPRRVAVLGAGPTGLTAARELTKLGHRVTVIERASQVGGMAATVEIDGLPYDLGAHLCTASYETVAKLARELSVETEPTTGYFVLDLERRGVVAQDHAIYAREAFERYERARATRFPRVDRAGLAGCAASLAAPAAAWLEAEGLGALGASMGVNYTAAGYGYLDDPDLAALYLVKFSEMIGALSPRHRLGSSWTFTIRGGFQRLWTRVAEELPDVRLGVAIDAIERREDGVVLHVGGERWCFDDLVIAVQPADALRVLDSSSEERELFAELETFEYTTTVCTAEGLPELGLYLLKQNCETSRNAGRPVAYHHRHAGSNVFLFYAYGGGKSDAELDDALRADVERLGGRVTEVRFRRRFRYMPHPSAHAIQGGFFERFEALQGRRRTYFAGSALAFELVECVASYAEELCARFFGETPAASVEAWLAREIAAELALPEPILVDEDLTRYRIDSVVAASILGSLSQRVGWSVPPHLVFDQSTVRAMVRGVFAARPTGPRAGDGPPAKHVVCLRAPVPPRPVFCVGGMMGAALYLRAFADALPNDRPFYAFQAPGLDGKDGPCDTVGALAELYLDELVSVQRDGPCTLVGHSFGGLVAYEMATRLAARGRAVDRVILLDTMLFAENEPSVVSDEAHALGELYIALHLRDRPDRLPDVAAIQAMPLRALRAAIAAAIAGPDAFLGEVSLSRWVKVYEAHSAAMRAYRPPARGLFPIVLVKAREGYPNAILHPSRERHACYDAPRLGWERLVEKGFGERSERGAEALARSSVPIVKGSFEVVTSPGNHYTMVFGDNARALGTLLEPFVRAY
jgi:acyl-CoA synthetase (AMP-forming)/AMP-acid ligase II/thioesterase domain-containing protein